VTNKNFIVTFKSIGDKETVVNIYPRTPLYAFQRNACSCWVMLANGHSSYLYLW